ncbi:IS66 family insertion sequence element accessory protein TnpB (plasmid) [Paraburkholderia strydomiana]
MCSATGAAIASRYSAWGGNGFWLLLKRLEADRFTWPSGTETISLTVEQLHWLLDVIDLAVIQKHPRRFYERIG